MEVVAGDNGNLTTHKSGEEGAEQPPPPTPSCNTNEPNAIKITSALSQNAMERRTFRKLLRQNEKECLLAQIVELEDGSNKIVAYVRRVIRKKPLSLPLETAETRKKEQSQEKMPIARTIVRRCVAKGAPLRPSFSLADSDLLNGERKKGATVQVQVRTKHPVLAVQHQNNDRRGDSIESDSQTAPHRRTKKYLPPPPQT